MARIAGIDLPAGKRLDIALTSIFGIGRSSAMRIVNEIGVDPLRKAGDLTQQEITAIRTTLEANYKVEGDLRRDVSLNIKRLVDLGSYKGLRHRSGLPVHGQRTKTNARTRKGKKKTVANKKKATK